MAGISAYIVLLVAIFYAMLWLGQKSCPHDRIRETRGYNPVCRRCGKHF